MFPSTKSGKSGQSEHLSNYYKFTSPVSEETGIKMLTSEQMLQRLPMTLAQVKAGNKSKKLLDNIRQMAAFLCQAKEITK